MTRLRTQSRPGTTRVLATLLTVAVSVALASGGPATAGDAIRAATSATTSSTTSSTGTLETQPPGPTTTRVSSFNVLGASHTAPGGNRKGWETGEVRMGYAVKLINRHALGIVGFQELQRPQFRVFRELAGTDYRTYPGMEFGTAALQNSITWRRDTWSLVSTRMVPVPYFDGNLIRKPLVLLQHRVTGQQVYVFNTHNPADTRGDAQRWRNEAVRIMIDLVNELRTSYPDIPVLVTGDMNDREKFFCPIVAGTDLEAANGGSSEPGGTCAPPLPTKIDWVLGTSDVAFTGYTALDHGLVNETTDHPLIWADAWIAPVAVRQADVRRVVVLDVEGLPSAALRARLDELPHLSRLVTGGASTFNARTARERTTSLPNLAGVLTGRRVPAIRGGHGVVANRDTGGTVHEAAGHYVSSAFDIVHNAGRHTALISSRSRVAMLARSWNATNGGADPAGDDHGTAKIDRVVDTTDDRATGDAVVSMLAKAPRALTVAQFSDPAVVGHREGFGADEYDDALVRLDRAVGRILRTIEGDRRLAATTLVVLTADSGGKGTSSRDRLEPRNYTIPFVVWGRAVPAGADLYAMNPAWTDPGTEAVDYSGPTPLRNSDVAGLVTGVLGLPGIPGSTVNPRQDLNVLIAPLTTP